MDGIQTGNGVSGKLGEQPEFTSTSEGRVECSERLGGLLRYYYREAA